MTVGQFSSKQTIEENRIFIINEEPYRYLGVGRDNNHLFMNEKTKKEMKMSNEDFFTLI